MLILKYYSNLSNLDYFSYFILCSIIPYYTLLCSIIPYLFYLFTFIHIYYQLVFVVLQLVGYFSIRLCMPMAPLFLRALLMICSAMPFYTSPNLSPPAYQSHSVSHHSSTPNWQQTHPSTPQSPTYSESTISF